MSQDDFKSEPILIKLLIVGDMGVGKSYFLNKWILEDTNRTKGYKASVGLDLGIQDVKIGDFLLRIQFFDIAGQERFMSDNIIPNLYFRNSDGVFIFGDISRPFTIKNAVNWSNLVDKYCDNIPKLLIINKFDLYRSNSCVIPDKEINQARNDAKFIDLFYTSNYDNIGIKESISSLLNHILKGKISKLTISLPIPKPISNQSLLSKLFNNNSNNSNNSNNKQQQQNDNKCNINIEIPPIDKNVPSKQIENNLVSINQEIQKKLIEQSEMRNSFKITYIPENPQRNSCFTSISNFFKSVLIDDDCDECN